MQRPQRRMVGRSEASRRHGLGVGEDDGLRRLPVLALDLSLVSGWSLGRPVSGGGGERGRGGG